MIGCLKKFWRRISADPIWCPICERYAVAGRDAGREMKQHMLGAHPSVRFEPANTIQVFELPDGNRLLYHSDGTRQELSPEQLAEQYGVR